VNRNTLLYKEPSQNTKTWENHSLNKERQLYQKNWQNQTGIVSLDQVHIPINWSQMQHPWQLYLCAILYITCMLHQHIAALCVASCTASVSPPVYLLIMYRYSYRTIPRTSSCQACILFVCIVHLTDYDIATPKITRLYYFINNFG